MTTKLSPRQNWALQQIEEVLEASGEYVIDDSTLRVAQLTGDTLRNHLGSEYRVTRLDNHNAYRIKRDRP